MEAESGGKTTAQKAPSVGAGGSMRTLLLSNDVGAAMHHFRGGELGKGEHTSKRADSGYAQWKQKREREEAAQLRARVRFRHYRLVSPPSSSTSKSPKGNVRQCMMDEDGEEARAGNARAQALR